MTGWRPQQFRKERPVDVSNEIIDRAIETAEFTANASPGAPPIFSLRHLAHYTGVPYGVLRSIASRSEIATYRDFVIHKRPAFDGEQRYRKISVPSAPLMLTQRWINMYILRGARPDTASTAFAPKCNIRDAADLHCQSKWLIKIDVQDFFSSINEISVYRVFRALGYQPLVSFELARLCTRLGSKPPRICWENLRPMPSPYSWAGASWKAMSITSYANRKIGYLPQGAPSSPMLANLAMKSFDQALRKLAAEWGCIYSRYADDITLSTRESLNRDVCRMIIGEVYGLLKTVGLSPNLSKTRVVPPGSRKVVLGLLVDGVKPRLPRDFRMRLRQHLHFLEKPNGPSQHASRRGFTSISGLRHHLEGLTSFATQIEPEFGEEVRMRLRRIAWPA